MGLIRARVATLVLILIASSACQRDADQASRLAAALRQVVAGQAVLPVPAVVWTDVRKFYEQRGAAPAWVSGVNDAKMSRAATVLEVLQSAPAHGFAPEAYGEPSWPNGWPPSSNRRKMPRIAWSGGARRALTTALLAFE